jgi:hypothetical protein
LGDQVSLSYLTGIPDPNQISSPQLVVVFKNVLKRDSTTREKALAEFLNILQRPDAAGLIDSNLHKAWVMLYPKLSIDASRTVRTLSHKVQGLVCKILGKQSSKHLKDSIGPWIAGIYDTDRAVALSAESSLEAVFPTDEKRQAIWKLFEGTLLDFVYTVVAVETVFSLSDERYISKDEAEAKYLRVIRSSLIIFVELLKKVDAKSKFNDKYLSIIQYSKFWKLAYCSDPAVLRAMFDLTISLVSNHPKWTELVMQDIATNVVYKGLKSSMSLVITDFLQTLIVITNKYPNVWEYANSKKTSSISALCEFTRAGSRKSSRYFWPSLLALLTSLPAKISPYSSECSDDLRTELIDAIAEGVNKELLPTMPAAWGSYLTVVEKSGARNSDVENALSAVYENIITAERPIGGELSMVLGKKLAGLCGVCWTGVNKSLTSEFEDILKRKNPEHLKRLSSILKSAAVSDQKHLAEFFSRFAAKLLNALKTGIEVFEINVLLSILEIFRSPLKENRQLFNEFVADSVPSFIVSDAAEDLLNIVKLYAEDGEPVKSEVLQKCFDGLFSSILSTSFPEKKKHLFPLALKTYDAFRGLVVPIAKVSDYLTSIGSNPLNWDLVLYGIAAHGVFVEEETSRTMLRLISGEHLTGPNTGDALSILSSLLELEREYLIAFVRSEDGKDLVSQLWKLENSEAERILAAIEEPVAQDSSTLNALCEGLLRDVESPMIDHVDVFVERGQRLLDLSTEKSDYLCKLLFENSDRWESRLNQYFAKGVNSELAVADSLDGAILLVSDSVKPTVIPLWLYSMAIYSSSMIAHNFELFKSLPLSTQENILVSLALVSEMAASDVFLLKESAEDVSFLTDALLALNEDVSAILLGFMKDATSALLVDALLTQSKGSVQAGIVCSLWEQSIPTSARGYYAAKALATVLGGVFPSTADAEVEALVDRLKPLLRKSELGATALIRSFQPFLVRFPVFDKLRNQLASEFIGVSAEKLNDVGLRNIVLLNILLPAGEEYVEPIPVNRLLMFLKSFFTWCESDYAYSEKFLALRIEITKLLSKLVLLYNSLPAGVLNSCFDVLEQDFVALEGGSPLLKYFTLRYYVALNGTRSVNPDVAEIWEERQQGINDELLDVLFSAKASENQPERIVNLQLQKAALKAQRSHKIEQTKLYEMLNLDSLDLQRISFVLLHRQIPSLQEDRSVEFEFQKNKEEVDSEFLLPSQLLSLIRLAPTSDSDHDISRYLWSWLLVYDHFVNASFDLRKSYINQIRTEDLVDRLLDFISARIMAGGLESTTASAVDMTSYSGEEIFESLPAELDFLYCHVFYVALQQTGSQGRLWFLNLKKRNVNFAVEKFAEKNFSPVIIKKELDEVETRLSAESGLTDENMSAKVSRTSNEIKAFYTTDEQTMEIAVRMPSLYPLKDLQVEGVRRIGVRENQWRAWLFASQAIATSQNGSIMDALELFKRNVTLHFEGIVECAICYSILHEDHTLPNKTCLTCKKKFHADCLYKWFKSAGSSSCPLCRSTFSFRHGLN